MEDTKKPVTGIGVPDGDGGSLEREEKKDNLTREDKSTDDGMLEKDDEEINPLEDEGDWAENPDENNLATADRANSLGNDSDNRRENESIEGALNNSGVITGGSNFSMLKYFNIEFI